MWNDPPIEKLMQLPKIYESEQIPYPNKLVHMHMQLGSDEFYAAEYDGEGIFFGYTFSYEDGHVELGNLSIDDMKLMGGTGYDPEWHLVLARQIPQLFLWGARRELISDSDPIPWFVSPPLCGECSKDRVKTVAGDFVIFWPLNAPMSRHKDFMCRFHKAHIQNRKQTIVLPRKIESVQS